MIRTIKYFDNNTSLPIALAQFFKDIDVPVTETGDAPTTIDALLGDNCRAEFTTICTDAYWFGLITDDAFEGISVDKPRLANLRNRAYDALMVFGVDIKRQNTAPSESPREGGVLPPTRTQLFNICRAFNREFPEQPVIVVFRYQGHFLSLGVCERLAYKDKSRIGDKVGKVSLLRDVDVRDGKTHAGHLRILQDMKIQRSGKNAVNTFEQLYAYWQSVLNVSVLNKRFYEELSNWYFWALGEVTFPDEPTDSDADKLKTHRANNVIRLITRLMFTWFLKEKKLVSDALFDIDELTNAVDFQSLTPDEDSNSVYYTAILQNLFFATLNQEMDKRRFKSDKTFQGKNEDFDNKTVYRHKRLFKSEQAALNLFKDIPFLNGGLFECLDQPTKNTTIDGFSDKTTEQPKLPNYLFFKQNPENINRINEDYGTSNKKYPVRGIINILKDYKFTVAENTPLEEEIALDPELLGRIFENLLASYNPETKTSARKQTGSFYTPREIVNYMVDESLMAYLKNALLESHAGTLTLGKQQVEMFGELPNKKMQLSLETRPNASRWQGRESELDAQLHQLFDASDTQPFTNIEDVKNLINALDTCKILDPACGSGAFPMGILHRMVALLHKLDPNNVLWKQRQLDNLNGIEDQQAREEAEKAIEKAFEKNELDYGRKLYLIENCVYGVDIQPIAVQIAKLRFFISLVCDQKTDDTEGVENCGVLALPNLETKFVAANTLIGLDTANLIKPLVVDDLMKERKNLHHRIFSAKNFAQKKRFRLRDEEIRLKIKDELQAFNGGGNIEQLAEWNPFNQNASAPFFDAEWMFNIKNGFDVVIGNPPYGANLSNEEKKLYYRIYKHQDYQLDTYLLFIEKSFQLMKNEAVKAFIIPNTWLINLKIKKFRKYIVEQNTILNIVHYHKSVFENAVVDTQVVIFKKQISTNNLVTILEYIDIVNPKITTINQDKWKKLNGETINIFISQNSQAIIDIIKQNGSPLLNICDVVIGMKPYQVGKGKPKQTKEVVDNRIFDATEKLDNTYRALLRGKDINKYVTLWDGKRWIKYGDFLAEPRYSANFDLPEKIVIRQTSDRLIATLDTQKFVCMNNMHVVNSKDKNYNLKYVLAIINSKVMDFYYEMLNPEKGEALAEVKKENVEKLLIKLLEPVKQIPFITLVDYILFQKRTPSVPAHIGQYFERLIDGMVCELYFEEEMRLKGVDIMGLVTATMAGLPDFAPLSTEAQQAQIENLHRQWTAPASEINNRLSLMVERSPDVLGVILGGK